MSSAFMQTFLLASEFAICKLIGMDASSLYEQLKGMGIGKGYASAIANGHRKIPLKLAIRIFRETGAKLGPIADATKTEIAALERIGARRALS